MSEVREAAHGVLRAMCRLTNALRREGRPSEARAARRLHDRMAEWANGMLGRIDAGAPVIDLARERARRAQEETG